MTTLVSRIALLATGNELTEGDILNTNGQKIAQLLVDNGLVVGLHVITSDDENDIVTALRFLLSSHQIVIITGGLGPTSDDRTRYALSTVLNKELLFDEISWKHICVRFAQLKRVPHVSNRQQALFPAGAHIILNENGSAPGCAIDCQNKTIYMLPGPPGECLPMFEEAVLPTLIKQNAGGKRTKLSWLLHGAVESEIAAMVDEIVKPYSLITGYRFERPYLQVKIYLQISNPIDEIYALVNNILQPYLVDGKKEEG